MGGEGVEGGRWGGQGVEGEKVEGGRWGGEGVEGEKVEGGRWGGEGVEGEKVEGGRWGGEGVGQSDRWDFLVGQLAMRLERGRREGRRGWGD